MPKIYLAQMKPILHDKQQNLQKFKQFMIDAFRQGADLILFPEMALTGYFTRDRTEELAEDIQEGESIQQVAKWANEYQLMTVFGFPEKRDGSVFNSACLISSDGTILGTYQKNHLWDEEYKYFTPGNSFPVWKTKIGTIGIMICYDTEFPEVARSLAIKGAEIILAPTANMTPLEHSQKVYIQSRAAENQVFVLTTNRVGNEETTYFFGESSAADPYGRLLVFGDQSESSYLVNLELEKIEQSRKAFHYLKERRPEAYTELLVSGTDKRQNPY